ncbi:MAG TPA: glycosyltransferase family 4 protein, partial [Chloroflexia bacterium]|nr:glycosyltransferase family 4 protein [Chloroflexia bacterium]
AAARPAGAATRDAGTLLFVGNFNHPPNVDAAVWLVEAILPIVRAECPGVRLLLVGKDPPSAVRALASAGVAVTGTVPEVAPYLREATVFVAPLRQGGGMRIKVLEALASGIPVITTPVGAAGIVAQPGRDLLVAEDAAAFAAAALRALEDPALRDRLGAAGAALAHADSRGSRAAQLLAVLEAAARRGPPRGSSGLHG